MRAPTKIRRRLPTLRRVNLAANLTASAEVLGEKTALRLDDLEMSYGALDVASARVAGLLRERGVGPGDRVGLMLPSADGKNLLP